MPSDEDSLLFERDEAALVMGEHAHRRRFTIAHEIAHFLLHPNFIGDEVTDENAGDGMYRSKLSNASEIEANKFASDLIMPIKLVHAFRQQNPKSDWREVAEHFDVTPEAMKIRFQQIKWGKARDLS